MCTAAIFKIVEKKLYGCADDSIFIAVAPSPDERVVVVGHTVGSISSKTLAYDCLCTLELCTASMIATS